MMKQSYTKDNSHKGDGMTEKEMQEKLGAVDELSKNLLVVMGKQELSVGVTACLSIAVSALAAGGANREEAIKHITVGIGLLYDDFEAELANNIKH